MLLSLFICVLLATYANAKSIPHFQQWFPQYEHIFQGIVNNNCSTAFQHYLRGFSPTCPEDSVGCVPSQVVDCILNNTAESMKANMAAAAVLLGLLPTTMCLVGSNTAETGLLALRRPLLAFLIATGSPAVAPIRTFEYRNPMELLSKRPDSVSPSQLSKTLSIIIIVLEYAFACTAVANLAHISWQMCIYSICTFSYDTDFQPALWAFLAIAIHLSGTYALHLRVHLVESDKNKNQSFLETIQREFRLNTHKSKAQLEFRQESYSFTFISWLTSTGTVLHIIYGTTVFSSTLFISTQDALSIVVRYLASTTVCRAILMFEINGMRNSIQVEGEGTLAAV